MGGAGRPCPTPRSCAQVVAVALASGRGRRRADRRPHRAPSRRARRPARARQLRARARCVGRARRRHARRLPGPARGHDLAAAARRCPASRCGGSRGSDCPPALRHGIGGPTSTRRARPRPCSCSPSGPPPSRRGSRSLEANVDAVVRICWQLDGMPLALELAAARAAVLHPSDIADRLERGQLAAATEQSGGARAPAHAHRHPRLESPSAVGGRADPVPPPGGLRRQLLARRGGGGVRRRAAARGRGARPARRPGGPVAGPGRREREGDTRYRLLEVDAPVRATIACARAARPRRSTTRHHDFFLRPGHRGAGRAGRRAVPGRRRARARARQPARCARSAAAGRPGGRRAHDRSAVAVLVPARLLPGGARVARAGALRGRT